TPNTNSRRSKSELTSNIVSLRHILRKISFRRLFSLHVVSQRSSASRPTASINSTKRLKLSSEHSLLTLHRWHRTTNASNPKQPTQHPILTHDARSQLRSLRPKPFREGIEGTVLSFLSLSLSLFLSYVCAQVVRLFLFRNNALFAHLCLHLWLRFAYE